LKKTAPAHRIDTTFGYDRVSYENGRKGLSIMDKLKILVVDDEARMRKLVRDFLVRDNFDVVEAGDGEEALNLFYEDKSIALVILDVMMPKMDGWQVVREIRRESKVPVIMLTARGEERDELLGFELGVDEYISKPFSPRILVARVEAILRRTNQISADDKLSVGGVEINKSAHLATVDGKTMDLSYKEFELLTYFLENAGIALSREKILNNVWNYDYFGDARTIDTHVKKLRSKMGEKGNYIRTIWGMGYKFDVESQDGQA
jgi:DNA-binding response OmpR family regulator